MSGVKSYRDLLAWQRAMDLAEGVYVVTRRFPREEIYGLTSQVRRAAVSVPSNIAEGQCRKSTREFLHSLSIGLGSLGEVETQLILSERLSLLGEADLKRLLDLSGLVGRLTNGLYNSLEM